MIFARKSDIKMSGCYFLLTAASSNTTQIIQEHPTDDKTTTTNIQTFVLVTTSTTANLTSTVLSQSISISTTYIVLQACTEPISNIK
jgi:hypothetical protein